MSFFGGLIGQVNPEIGLAFVDWVIILMYFGLVIGMGIYLKKYTNTGEGFFLAGRSQSAWVAGLAFLSANLGALELLGWTAGTAKYGIHAAHFYWIGAVPAMLFLGLFMMPFYYNSNIHSVPGYLKARFDEKTRVLNAMSFGVMTVLMSGVNLYLMAKILNIFLAWDMHICMWVSAAAVGAYITLGGLLSAMFTEIVQFFLIWFGLFLVAVLGIIDVGGPTALFDRLPPEMGSLWSNTGDASANAMEVTFAGIILGLGFVLSFGYWTTDFLVVQRAFSSKDLRSARLTPILASFFKMALPVIVCGAGLVAYSLWDTGVLPVSPTTGKPDYDAALPLLVQRYFPAGLVGLGVTALLAGFMAGQAGNVTAFNTVWTYDIYKPLINPNASDRHLVWMGRVTTVVGIIISIGTAYIAMSYEAVMDYIQAIFSWVNAPLFATILLGMFWKRTTAAGAFWGLLAGMIVSFTLWAGMKWDFLPASAITFADAPSDMTKNLWQATWSWVVCFGLTFLITLVTKPKPDEELKGLVRSLTPIEKSAEEAQLWRTPKFWGAISLIVLIILNILFW